MGNKKNCTPYNITNNGKNALQCMSNAYINSTVCLTCNEDDDDGCAVALPPTAALEDVTVRRCAFETARPMDATSKPTPR
mmetsp:Transcript_15572/g.18480  ORF Transcript_15572/g.18480 Transcript_15572/m.18480 type:complete len:80 (-) Transcript_15572:808-1047(-)